MLRRLTRNARTFSAVALLVAFTPALHAQVTGYFWQAPNGGNGTWDTVTAQWGTSSTSASTYTWQNNGLERANFGTTTIGTVQIQPTGVIVNGINFNLSGYTLAGGGGNINWAGGNVNIGSGNTGTIAAIIAGTTNFAKIGLGTLILTGPNTFSSGFNISGGGTVVGVAQASGSPFSSGSLLLDTAVLRLNGIASQTTTTIGDFNIASVNINSTAAGNLVIDATAGGTTIFAAGNLVRLGRGGVLGVTGQTSSLGTNEQFTFTNSGTLLAGTNGTMLPAWLVARSPTNAIDFTSYGANGLQALSYDSSDLTTSTGTMSVNQSSAPTINANVSAYALKTSAPINLNGNQLSLGNGSGQTGLILAGASVTNGTVNFGNTEGIVYVSGTTALGSLGNTIASNALTFVSPGTASLTINGNIGNGSGATQVVYSGYNSGNALEIDGNNTYTGGTYLEWNTGAGANIILGSDTAFGAGKVTNILSPGAQSPQMKASSFRTLANAFDLNGGITFTGTNGFLLTGPINLIGGRTLQTNITPGSVTFGSSAIPSTITLGNPSSNGGDDVGKTLTLTASATTFMTVNDQLLDPAPGAGGNLSLTGGGTIIFNGTMNFSGGIASSGGGTLIFNNPNSTYTGTTSFNGGGTTIELAASSSGIGNAFNSGPLGTETIQFNSGTNQHLRPSGAPRSISNPISLMTGVVVDNNPSDTSNLTLAGPIYLNSTASRTWTDSMASGATLFLGDSNFPSVIVLNPATSNGASINLAYNTNAGNTTVLNDVIQDPSPAPANLDSFQVNGTGSFVINSLSTFAGTFTLGGATSIVLNTSSQSGSGPFGVGPLVSGSGSNAHLMPSGADRTIANPLLMQFGFLMDNIGTQSFNLTFTGPVTLNTTTGRTFSNGTSAGTTGGSMIIGDPNSPSTITLNNASNQALQFAALNGPIIVNDRIVDPAGVTLPFAVNINPNSGNNGTVIFNSSLSTYIGGTKIGGGSNGGGIVGIGASSVGTFGALTSGPFGLGSININQTTTPPVLVPIGGDRTIANAITLTSGLFVANTANNLALNGPITLGATSRVLTNNMIGSTTLTLGAASGPATITLGSNLAIQSQGAGVTSINDQVTGAGGIIAQVGGTVYLNNGNNNYAGGTQVTGGRLVANNTGGSATGSGAVSVTGTGALGSGGVLGGTGTISGPISISSTTAGSQGGVLSPGNSPGTLNVGNMQWNPLGQYVFEHDATNNATGGGVNDFVNGSGSLDLSTLGAGNQFDLKLAPITIPNAPTAQSTYVLATFAQGIFGASGQFPNGADLSSLFTISGSFKGLAAPDVTVAGAPGGPQSLDLSFTPVPEPGTVGLLALGLCTLSLRRKRGLIR